MSETQTAGRDPVLELDEVAVHFTKENGLFEPDQTVRAVDGVSLTVAENDVVVLVGESGCGKTTLGKTAIALQRPTSGSVRYRGQDVWEAKRGNGDVPFEEIRRALQIIHQDPGSSLNPNRTILSQLQEPLKRWQPDLSRDDRIARILGMLEQVAMTPPDDYARRYPFQLSGGERQRVALVRALLMNPEVVLADEAVSALDVSLRVEMMDLMLEMQEFVDTSYLFVSHNLSNARYIANRADGRIAVMYLGQIVEIGSPEEVLTDTHHPYTDALKWATPGHRNDADGEMPITSIDIPDPVDPPSGCRFHTRCPYARETCREETPALRSSDGSAHRGACFRIDETHEYWNSPSIVESEPDTRGPTADAE